MDNSLSIKENKKAPLIVLTGPTAVGKTNLSIKLAKAVNGEIISADSMQVYKRMDIGSAKITQEEMQGITHHLIDILEPTQEFNIVLFKELAQKAIQEITERGHIPIITGGTGFYIQALLYDIAFEQHDEESPYRKELEEIAGTSEGIHILHDKLKVIDPAYAELTHENNVRRVIRALEFYNETGKRLSEHNTAEMSRISPYNFAYFVLTDKREVLYDRIDLRVDKMISMGLVEEVRRLVGEGLDKSYLSMQGLGYKEIYDYLIGEITLDEAIYIIKRDTRHFAKRQLTWFRREKEVTYIDKSLSNDDGEILARMIDILKNKEII